MSRYSVERKELVIQKMMPPNNIPIPQLAEETGISDVTLYNWRKQARLEGIAVPADGKNSEKWSSEDKFTTSVQRHTGEDSAILEHRQQVYREARARHPNRWSVEIRNWELPGRVLLNPEKQLSDLNQAA